jgi:hypothetical protein
MTTRKQSVLSLEYVSVQVGAKKLGVAYNPTADVVQMAFVAPGTDPVADDWKAAVWETQPGPKYVAECLVGPGGTVALPVETYQVWVKVTDAPEIPATPVMFLEIY